MNPSARVAAMVAIGLAAPSAFAHGEDVVYLFYLLYCGIPGIVLLLTPWHRFPLRLLATAVLAGAGALVWMIIVPRIADPESIPRLGEWAILFGPAILGVAVAVFLRVTVRRRA